MSAQQSPFAERDFIDLELPIRTDRLLLRAGRVDDVDSLHARRNQRAVQEYQSWTFPYAREDAAELLTSLEKMSGPTLGEWWMVMVDLFDEDRGHNETVGDVAVHLDESGSIAEIGYNLSPDYWGRGYATEAVAAVIDSLYGKHPELIRLQAQVHPDNVASAGVVERCGLHFEGQTRLSFVPQDANQQPSDDCMYSLLRQDWESWNRRPMGRAERVGFVEIVAENVRSVCELETHKSQDRLVAPVVHSLAHALVPPVRDGSAVRPWYRAVEADGELVGFVMLAQPTEVRPDPYLWRMLVDRRHQRRGIGRTVLDMVVDQARAWGGSKLMVSWVPGPGSPERFYLQYGFEPVGPPDDSGEIPGVLAI
jgi:RimJ/RimL family protein N-acetyltransferase